MGIFDVFTGKPAKEAAQQQRMFLAQTGAGNNAAIDTGVGLSLNALGQGYDTGVGSVNQGYDIASNALNTGATGARGAYQPLVDLGGKYGGATTLALNALGVNGADGTAAARDAFTAGPAYAFNRDEGIEAINRRRAAGGMLDSGNADRDAQIFGANLASNEWDKWLDDLLGFTSPELAATSGAATGLAGIETGLGQGQAGLATQRGTMLADLGRTYGQNQAGIHTGAATAKVNSANQLAQPYANTYGKEAEAEMAGSKNLWDLGLNAAKAGVQAAAMFSDIRVKDDVEQVGTLRDGTPVYSFRYKGDPVTRIGLMAQDVEEYAPEAVIEIGGIKAVDYRLATERSRKMAEV